MKRILLAVSIVVVIALGWFVYYTYPRHIARTLSGLEYRTGSGHKQVTPVKLEVNGTLRKSIDRAATFQGIIRLIGAFEPNPDNNRQLTIHFDNDGGFGVMAYGYAVNGTPITHGYGLIFINNDFSKLTILENKAGWFAADGLTISAPASDRIQALNVSNELMKRWLKGFVLR